MLRSLSSAFESEQCILLKPEEIEGNQFLSRLASGKKPFWVDEAFPVQGNEVLLEEKGLFHPAFVCLPLWDETSLMGILYLGFAKKEKFLSQDIDLLILSGKEMGEAIRNASLHREAEQTISELKALYEMGRAVTSTVKLEDLLELILINGLKTLKAKGGVLRIADRTTGELEVKCSRGNDHQNPVDEKIAQRVFFTRTPISLNHSGEAKPFLSILCAPLLSKEKVLGTLTFYNKETDPSIFDERDFQLLLTMTNQMSCAIDNALLYWNLEEVHQELKEAQTQLCHHEKMSALGELSTTIAHEIKNPLVSIGGFARRLDRGMPEASQEKKYTQAIMKEVVRLEKIFNDTLSYVRNESLVFQEYDPREILEKSLSMISGGFDGGGIQLVKEFEGDLPKVIGNDQQLKQVFFNLVTNARQAMNGSGTLTLRLSPFSKNGSSFVKVEVEDTGKGIDPEDLHNIFNPFFSTKDGSLGLGLPIVHKIVTSHRGQIEVDNHPGRGVTFIVILPAKEG
jgi:signal transduction histidine kinase